MFESWGRVIYRRRWLTLVIAAAGIVIAAAWGTGVFGALTSGNSFTPPGSQSQHEADASASAFGRSTADVVVLYRSPALTVGDPGYRAAVTSALAGLPRGDVLSASTYWSTGSPRLVSADRHQTYAVIQVAGADDAAQQKTFKAIKADFSPPVLAAHGITAQVGGTMPTEVAINGEVTANIAKAEAFSMPVLLILLLLIFGGLVAASLPLAIGGTAILGSFAVLRLLTLFTTVSIYSLNITTILGLGLGIDYALFMVIRFREELRRQPTTEAAIARTVATAGRTIAVSGVTVALALTSLMLFPEVFLRSMGYGGVATVLVDMVAALTVLPALLSVLGPRVNALRVRRSLSPSAAASPAGEQAGAWYRLAHGVMRRPVAFVVVITIALLALATPFLRISWGGTDARSLPATAQTRLVTEALNRDFPVNSTSPIEALVTLPAQVTSPAGHAALAAYTQRLERVPGVTGAQVTAVHGPDARIDLGYRPEPTSAAARQIVQHVRAVAAPAGATVLVGGTTAQLVDELASLGSTLPWMALLVVVSTFVLLFLAFGSVVLPVKAIVMNVLSLSATFGVVVWIFQWGHLSRLLQFTPTGTIDPTMPILMAAIIFGLSMDYEVFLLSRIREAYDQTGDNTAAIATGLQRTGGLITSLALLLVIVIGAFSASGITFIKLLGVGMIVALVIDASVVRIMLVPATMRLLGRANWWAPGPLRRMYARYGIREEDHRPAPPVAAKA
ncbi:MAG TPA: MMPL family transporter [Streptosporangiaceae bacterium]